jgi:hypothetical protein
MRPIGLTRKREGFYPQISQILADYGGLSRSVALRDGANTHILCGLCDKKHNICT